MIRQVRWFVYCVKSVIHPFTRCSFSDTFMGVIFTIPLLAAV